MDFGGFVNFVLSAVIMLFFICAWGKTKRKIAYGRLKNAVVLVNDKEYLEAIRHLENIGDELKYDSMYWCYLAIALAGAGSFVDADEAAIKSLKLDVNNIHAKNILNHIKKQCLSKNLPVGN